ncbi:MAG: RagB/SusD family nutrient uptake outer membrane protein [Bacteroidales bacterium]|nr:RagB/SusD family nutrient uptake outer membrane protein [Bacteroidales bacterium]MCF8332924.1 RagB/SusD family nutrient uptake outer membrane protein [Bacteroidales bacterium]
MKRIIYLSILMILVSSCSKEKLDVDPKRIYYENFYQTEESALNAVNAVYDVLGQVSQYNSHLWYIADIASDDFNVNPELNDPNAQEFDRYTLEATNNYLEEVWQSSYKGISQANIVLEKVPSIAEMDSSLRQRIVGEAHYLRGLFYFNLVRMYGSVPIVTEPVSSDLSEEELYRERKSPDDVYALIVDDMQSAAEKLPDSYSGANKGRATWGAATSMLAKVHLTRQNWQQAANYADSVMSSGIYDLYDDYADNFKEANENGKESVFEVQFTSSVNSENSRIVISGLPYIQGVFPAGVEMMLPTDDLLDTFEEGDYRKEVTFFSSYWQYDFEPHVWKYWDQDAYDADETGQSGANFKLMRYAEVLLIYAEALNEVNGGPTQQAYDAVNRIRERARNGNEDVLPDLEGLGYEEFRQAVWKEKRCELVNEGQRWFDLKRTGRLIERVNEAKGDKANPQEYNYKFPIPQRERDLNPELSQNGGY